MRSSGLPCRANPECETVFTVERQDSMDALRDAVARRDKHEIEVHGYRHVIRDTSATPFAQTGSSRPRGRKPSDEIPV